MHIEVTSTDPAAAAEFYARAFGWVSEPSPHLPGYLTARTGSGTGIDAAIMDRRYQGQSTILWIAVDDIEVTLAAVEGAGGERGELHDLPGVGRVGYVTAPDGVVIGVKQAA